jgi:hypothetical protein
MRPGHYSKVGPIYRHQEEIRFCVNVATPKRLIRGCCRRLGQGMPRERHARLVKSFKARDCTALRLAGALLTLRLVNGRCSVSYRTTHPENAARELHLLFRSAMPGEAGKIRLTDEGRSYVEFYVAIRRHDLRLLKVHLPGHGRPNDSSLERPRDFQTFYGQHLTMPLGVRGSMPIALVMYQPHKTSSRDRVKLEIKGPTVRGKRRLVKPYLQNRMIGALRYWLSTASVNAAYQPPKWAGRLVGNNRRLGRTEKLVRQVFNVPQPRRDVSVEYLVKLARQHRIRRDNLLTTLNRMIEMGDLIPIRRSGRLRTVRLFQYHKISVSSSI